MAEDCSCTDLLLVCYKPSQMRSRMLTPNRPVISFPGEKTKCITGDFQTSAGRKRACKESCWCLGGCGGCEGAGAAHNSISFDSVPLSVVHPVHICCITHLSTSVCLSLMSALSVARFPSKDFIKD